MTDMALMIEDFATRKEAAEPAARTSLLASNARPFPRYTLRALQRSKSPSMDMVTAARSKASTVGTPTEHLSNVQTSRSRKPTMRRAAMRDRLSLRFPQLSRISPILLSSFIIPVGKSTKGRAVRWRSMSKKTRSHSNAARASSTTISTPPTFEGIRHGSLLLSCSVLGPEMGWRGRGLPRPASMVRPVEEHRCRSSAPCAAAPCRGHLHA